MSANETLDLDAIERAIGSLERGPRITVNGTDFAIIHARRLIAAVRERDAEIARLKQDQPRIPNAARLTTIANMIDRECDKFTFHWPTKRTETWRSEAAFLRALAGQIGTEPPQPAEGA